MQYLNLDDQELDWFSRARKVLKNDKWNENEPFLNVDLENNKISAPSKKKRSDKMAPVKSTKKQYNASDTCLLVENSDWRQITFKLGSGFTKKNLSSKLNSKSDEKYIKLKIPNKFLSGQQESKYNNALGYRMHTDTDSVNEVYSKGTLGLTMVSRPKDLPPKSQEESELHWKLYNEILRNYGQNVKQNSDNQTKSLDYSKKKEIKKSEMTLKWKNLLKNWNESEAKSRKYDSLWYSGIPSALREVFRELMKNARNDIYKKTEETEKKDETLVENIELDIGRTLPYLKLFQKGCALHEDLLHLLHCFSNYNSNIKYVQGMSYPMSIFILNLPLYEALNSFNNFVNSQLFTVLYSVNIDKLEDFLNWFRSLIMNLNPELLTHMMDIDLSLKMFLLDWLMTTFINIFDIELIDRIFDLYMREGPMIFIRCALVLLLEHSKEIISSSDNVQCALVLLKPFKTPNEDYFIEKLAKFPKFQKEYNDFERMIRYL